MRSSTFCAGSMSVSAAAISAGGMLPTMHWWMSSSWSNRVSARQRGPDFELFEGLVLKVVGGERREPEVQPVHREAAIDAGRVDGAVGEDLELGHLAFERRVLALDDLGQSRGRPPDVLLGELVFVLAVRDEHPDEVVPAGGDARDAVAVSGVDAAGRERDPEQAAAERLVDVAVKVEGERLERCGLDGQRGEGGGCLHRVLLGQPPGWGRRAVTRVSTIIGVRPGSRC